MRQQNLILELFRYRTCDTEQRQALAAKVRQAATVSAKPIYIFLELTHYIAEQRIVAPGYTLMQDTIGQALTHKQERLTTILSQYLSSSDVENLHRLVEDSPGLYEITQLKREPRDFSASEIKREIRRGKQIDDLYHLLIPTLEITAMGFPCCVDSPCADMPSPLPRRNLWVPVSLASPEMAALPVIQAGRLPHCPFQACSAFTHVTACILAEFHKNPLHERLQTLRYLHACSRCYRLE